MTSYCEVIFPLPLFQTFLYRLPEEMAAKVRVGSRVIAPLGQRKLTGYVLEIKNDRPEPDFMIKEIIDCQDEKPIWSESFIKFILALSDYSISPPGLFMKLSEPPSGKQKSVLKVRLTEKGQQALASGKLKGRKQDILSLLTGRQLSPLYLKRKLGIKEINTYLKSLEQNGFIEIKERVWKSQVKKIAQKFEPRQLRLPIRPEGESEAEKRILGKLARKENESFLVSGSQKRRQKLLTKLINFGCQENGLVLVLVPEIQRLEKWKKLSDGLSSPHILWHSQLTEKERRENWTLAISGEAKVVFGTRSALFLPVQPLSLIIIDEEQDDLYYQTEGPVFDARDAAEIRARIENSLVIFSSGCPDISRYYHHRERGTLIDLGEEKPCYNLSFSRMDIGHVIKKELKADIERQLATESQSFFFVNRKGYANYLFCPSCGFVARCQKCRIALSLKKKNGELTCGYCGETSQAPEQCPVCEKKLHPGRIKGSQYLKEQLSETFPEQAVEVLEEGLRETRIRQIVRQVWSGNTKLLVGTEYAINRLPEGLFSLVVLINPEKSLNLPDFRASERTFATIYKLLELARNDSDTKIVAVITGPEPGVIHQALNHNYGIFFEQEIEFRNLLNYPPFSRLVEVNLQAGSLRDSAHGSRQLLEKVRTDFPALEIIGPRITRQMWRREKKEIKLFLRVISHEQLAELLALLKEFRQKRSTTHVSVRIWK